MADINVERKGPSIWPWIIGLIVVALLIWALAEMLGDDDEVAEGPVAEVVEPGLTQADPPPPVPVAQGPRTLADLMGNPTAYVGQSFSTPQAVRVAEVVSDRGFWVEDQGQRAFVILNEGGPNAGPGTADVQGAAEKPVLRAGDMVQITEATVRDPSFLQNVQGPVDAQARQAAQGQTIFLVTDGRNVQKM